jgi:hypothetical protein
MGREDDPGRSVESAPYKRTKRSVWGTNRLSPSPGSLAAHPVPNTQRVGVPGKPLQAKTNRLRGGCASCPVARGETG